MKKEYFLIFVPAVIVMLVFPWAAVTFVKKEAGMLISILLLYVIYPISFIGAGIFSGRDIKKKWWCLIISATFFMLGAWIFLNMDVEGVILYTAIYVAVGTISMFISAIIKKKINDQVR